ncbi:MAG: hypothetical protein B6240_11250 [Desulfobacteraceae bacterium 4572_87]|nr:MAG: hypothetical protein B6240_11250 [Desulfobacteraceae bacterium 4572_87]
MDVNVAGKVKTFVESVSKLFAEIESWIALTNIKGIRQEIEISEETSGSYKVNKFILEDETGKKIVEFLPIGTFIIGGNGRIDLNGTIDKAIIVNLKTGGPSMTTTNTVGGRTEVQTTSFYKGIDQEGWYWIEDARRGKANFFSKDQFVELLQEVSDYELS